MTPNIQLNQEQAAALNVALNTREHLFVTGGPGVGKTLTMKEIIQGLRRKRNKVRVASFTGLAALHLQGTTLSRLLGTGLAKRAEELSKLRLDRAEENLDGVTDLVVDEVSMVSGDFLNMMDKVMQEATGEEEPFAGIRMIFCGDFMQLPPVRNNRDPEFKWKWAFQHPLFSLTRKITLVRSMRQADPRDIELLAELRHGVVSPTGQEVMSRMVGRELKNPTELYPINRTVHQVNSTRLRELEGKEHTFKTQYHPAGRKKSLQDRVPVGEEVTLKVGAPVIILSNNPSAGYVNGSQGVVTVMDRGRVRVRLNTGRMVTVSRKVWEIEDARGTRMGEVDGLPIHLGWAATIHRAQGMTLDAVKTDVSSCFEPGQAYVAMTRTRSLDHISLTQPVRDFQVDPEALAFTRSLERSV